MLRCFQQTELCHPALCEANPQRRAEIAAPYGVEAFASLEDAQARSWDAAVICTPAHLHIRHCLQLAPSTSAFLIEKPLATHVAEAAAASSNCNQRSSVQRMYFESIRPSGP